LAAAEFSQALARGDMGKEETGVTAMTLGETQRLLGRFDEAKATLARARASGGLDARTQHILDQIDSLAQAKDFNLARADRSDVKAPPIGWYLDSVLPYINGHITEYRSAWAVPAGADQVAQRILAQLK